jgi:polyhydroxyalkanoate synthesis regulator phasin
MPENDLFKRYLDVGITFTQLTRAKAEELVNQWVKAGEVGVDQAQARVDDLVERSRRNSEQFFDFIRKEIANQLSAMGLATKTDLATLEARVTAAEVTAAAAATAAARPAKADRAPRKAPARRAPAKATGAGKVATKKATAAKRSTAKKATAAKRGAAKRTPRSAG